MQAAAHVLSRGASGEEVCSGMVDWILDSKLPFRPFVIDTWLQPCVLREFFQIACAGVIHDVHGPVEV